MTLNSCAFFFTISVLLPFISSTYTHILFFPSPSNSETLPSFVNIAQILTKTDNYTCSALIYGSQKALSWAGCTTLSYGVEKEDVFSHKLQEAQNKFYSEPIFGLNAYKEIYQIQIDAFFDAIFIYELRQLNFDIILCDAGNLFCNLMAEKLRISKIVYFASTISNFLWIDQFRMPISYSIMPNTTSMDTSSLVSRAKNLINYYVLVFTTRYQHRLINQLLSAKGETFNKTKSYIPTALFLTQDIAGLTDPVYLPPNIVFLGCVSCLFSDSYHVSLMKQEETMNNFIEKYKRNIVVKLDQMRDHDEVQMVYKIFKKFSQIGFLVQGNLLRGKVTANNILEVQDIAVSKILAKQKVIALINNGDYSSIIEGIYFQKPMLVLSYNFDRRANGAFVVNKGFGIAINNKVEFTEERFHQELKNLIANQKKFQEEMRIYSMWIEDVDSEYEVEKWFGYYAESGIDELIVKQYYEMTLMEYYNLDILSIVISILCAGIVSCCGLIKRWSRRQRKVEDKVIGNAKTIHHS